MPWPSSAYAVAEVDGNRTRQPEMLGLNSFEDRGDHQVLAHLRGQFSPVAGCPDCPKLAGSAPAVTPVIPSGLPHGCPTLPKGSPAVIDLERPVIGRPDIYA